GDKGLCPLTPPAFLKNCWTKKLHCLCFAQMKKGTECNHPVPFLFKAIPHKDCASDAPSDFSSDETKSAVNTLCIHEHFCEI
ncbi:hypothetical protein, partial [uncultured Ruminococcus sp.]|uniref:hypothetical protein n=1 Tax=uncultured Ruminococcus sp. TaxID=165186 RepID=UPI002628D428